MNAKKLTGCLALLACVFAQGTSAASMRCGNYLIHDAQRSGTTKYEVLKKCGEPTSRMGHTWIYRKGSRDVMLQFNGSGNLLSIKNQ